MSEAYVLIPILLSAAIYAWGIHHAWQRAGRGRGIPWNRPAYFLGAILILTLAFVQPLDGMSEELFSAHMVQHLILILIAAPLLVLSDVPLVFLWAFSEGQARACGKLFNRSRMLFRLGKTVSHPIFAWLLFTVTLWLWHAPVFFESALHNEAIHVLEHLGFLLSAVLFWWVLLKNGRPDHVHYAMAIPYLFLTVLQSSILGALMTFSTEPWYPSYAESVARWDFALLQDQQLAGLIMWVPVGVVFTVLTIGYFAAWLQVLEKRDGRLQRDIPIRQELK